MKDYHICSSTSILSRDPIAMISALFCMHSFCLGYILADFKSECYALSLTHTLRVTYRSCRPASDNVEMRKVATARAVVTSSQRFRSLAPLIIDHSASSQRPKKSRVVNFRVSFYELLPQQSILRRYDPFPFLRASFLDICIECNSSAARLYIRRPDACLHMCSWKEHQCCSIPSMALC